MDDEGSTLLFFTAGAKDVQVMTKLPANHKKKAAYALKPAECKFDEKKLDEMFEKCIVGSLGTGAEKVLVQS